MILLNDFRRQWEDTRETALAAFASVGESGWYILGHRVAEFEAAVARAWGMQYAVGVASGMDALEIALTILGCKRGDKVLTTPLSAFATTLSILRTGATPVFVDTDEHGLLDLAGCRKTLQNRPDIRFLMPVHLYGNAMDLEELQRLQDDFGVAVVEDCAQSILATFRGKPTGTASKLAATSFYPTKNLGAMGDGGAVLTNDYHSYEAARVLRDYGQTGKYLHDRIGYNSRLDELQAALIATAYLPKLEQWTAQRRKIARSYLEGIQHSEIRCLGQPAGSESCWHLFPVLVNPNRKRAFMEYLKAQDVSCGEHYPVLIPQQRALADHEFEVIGDCRIADCIRSSEISLPIHPYLTDQETACVIDVCNAWKAS